jgi:hypothetical protein
VTQIRKSQEITFDKVQRGVALLNALMSEADAQGDANGRLSPTEFQSFLDTYSEEQGGVFEGAMVHVFELAKHLTGNQGPALSTVEEILTAAEKELYLADTNGTSGLSHDEIMKLGEELRSIASFAGSYGDKTLDDILNPTSPAECPGGHGHEPCEGGGSPHEGGGTPHEGSFKTSKA